LGPADEAPASTAALAGAAVPEAPPSSRFTTGAPETARYGGLRLTPAARRRRRQYLAGAAIILLLSCAVVIGFRYARSSDNDADATQASAVPTRQIKPVVLTSEPPDLPATGYQGYSPPQPAPTSSATPAPGQSTAPASGPHPPASPQPAATSEPSGQPVVPLFPTRVRIPLPVPAPLGA